MVKQLMGTITAFIEPMSKMQLSDAAPESQDSCLPSAPLADCH